MDERRVRDRASELRMLADGMSAPYIVPSTKETMALAMLNAAREMDELADENAELRERLDGAHMSRLLTENENETLRELVRHLRECTRHNVCAACEYADDACDFDYDLRKLGIEVDE